MTINKSQSQTMKKVGIYLPTPVFGHGQLYVAMSRVGRLDDLKVRVHNKLSDYFSNYEQVCVTNGLLPGTPHKGTYTRNIVWQEALA